MDCFLGLRGEPCVQIDPALEDGDGGEVEKVESNELRLHNSSTNEDKSYNALRWVYQDIGGGIGEDITAIDEHMLETMVKTFALRSHNVALILFGSSSTRKREFSKELAIKVVERMVETIDKHDGGLKAGELGPILRERCRQTPPIKALVNLTPKR